MNKLQGLQISNLPIRQKSSVIRLSTTSNLQSALSTRSLVTLPTVSYEYGIFEGSWAHLRFTLRPAPRNVVVTLIIPPFNFQLRHWIRLTSNTHYSENTIKIFLKPRSLNGGGRTPIMARTITGDSLSQEKSICSAS